ncbi:hypothetical protein AVEN_195978-1 [Araneus ventricosus]|uniref:Uncharacterized protein n=1 Tax=Araneus ventricosus TaxID=182803 RepID=A0A4Y2DU28_ARAVE|nr:hypothetical protein AVEN_195978-1 [Araneus ventricosus]
MYQREQILFTIMLTMVKSHVIKYHKKPSSHPFLAPGSSSHLFLAPLNDRPPRLLRALWSPHNSSHYEHTTITVSTKGASTCSLIRQLLIREFRHAGIM